MANLAKLLADLPPRRLDTLREIKRRGPESIYAAAKLVAPVVAGPIAHESN